MVLHGFLFAHDLIPRSKTISAKKALNRYEKQYGTKYKRGGQPVMERPVAFPAI